MTRATNEDTGLDDAAILLMTVGEEQAAEVFKFLGPREVEKLGERMARLKTVPRERIEAVVESFNKAAEQQVSPVPDPDAFVGQVLRRALGDEKAELLLARIVQGRDVSAIESLKWMDAAAIAELLRDENPQVVASILAHLDHSHAAGVLKQLAEPMRNEVLLRIATLDGIQAQAMEELNEVLTKVLAGGEKPRKAAPGGAKTAAEILKFLGGQLEAAAVEAIRAHDADLAQQIVDQMFTFAHLESLDNRGIQMLLREVESESLIIALKGADASLREKIFSNMSTRAAETLREDLEAKGPVRLSEVQAEQRNILDIARRLAEEGQLQLSRGGGDDEFV